MLLAWIHPERMFASVPRASQETEQIAKVSPSVRASVRRSARPSLCLSVYPSACLSVRLSILRSIRLFARPSVCPSVCRSVNSLPRSGARQRYARARFPVAWAYLNTFLGNLDHLATSLKPDDHNLRLMSRFGPLHKAHLWPKSNFDSSDTLSRRGLTLHQSTSLQDLSRVNLFFIHSQTSTSAETPMPATRTPTVPTPRDPINVIVPLDSAGTALTVMVREPNLGPMGFWPQGPGNEVDVDCELRSKF